MAFKAWRSSLLPTSFWALVSCVCVCVCVYNFYHFLFTYYSVCSEPSLGLPRGSLKNPPAMRETWVRPLGWEDPLEKGKPTHSSILAWRILRTVYSPWGRKELDMTERVSLHLSFLAFLNPSCPSGVTEKTFTPSWFSGLGQILLVLCPEHLILHPSWNTFSTVSSFGGWHSVFLFAMHPRA